MKSLVVTGGAGFIGSAFVRIARAAGYRVTIYDSLTYAGHMPNVEECLAPGTCDFVRGDIRDAGAVQRVLRESDADAVVNFAAETHVDNSIEGPRPFVETNVLGTFGLLEAVRANGRADFRFVHVSTDEVFGELGEGEYFTETSPYQPNSPYSASKAASDHLVRAWIRTYGLPALITNCSNNYGPRQFPEKLIPRMITCALRGEPLPVFGRGANVRDWIHVEDHARGVLLALEKGGVGESYCFGGRSERRNLRVVEQICALLDERSPRADKRPHATGITFVTDRLGHDYRYAIDDTKAERELGFVRRYPDFESGLRQTVDWYLNNSAWLRSVQEKKT